VYNLLINSEENQGSVINPTKNVSNRKLLLVAFNFLIFSLIEYIMDIDLENSTKSIERLI